MILERTWRIFRGVKVRVVKMHPLNLDFSTCSLIAAHQEESANSCRPPHTPISFVPQFFPLVISAQETGGVSQGPLKPANLAQSCICGTYHLAPRPPRYTVNPRRENSLPHIFFLPLPKTLTIYEFPFASVLLIICLLSV